MRLRLACRHEEGAITLEFLNLAGSAEHGPVFPIKALAVFWYDLLEPVDAGSQTKDSALGGFIDQALNRFPRPNFNGLDRAGLRPRTGIVQRWGGGRQGCHE
jgi:hypothetical protein